MRVKYKGDLLAQMQIDNYDPLSELGRLVRKHKEALKDGNDIEAERLEGEMRELKRKKYGIET